VTDFDENDFYIGENPMKIKKFEHKKSLQTPANSAPGGKLKLVNIVTGLRGGLNFHFEIDGKMYFYGMTFLRGDLTTVLKCMKNPYSRCSNRSTILYNLKDCNYQKIFKNHPNIFYKSDPSFFDIHNYDINSFDIEKGHSCAGHDIVAYYKKYKPEVAPEFEKYQEMSEFKLVKIANRRGHPTFHFEISGKIYFYAFEGVKADYTIVLSCTKSPKSKCTNVGHILPSDCLKEIIKNTPEKLLTTKCKYPKILVKSDPRVYDINSYDINSFEMDGSHTCPGRELDVYYKSIFPIEN
jgi:hypothetical protein